MRNDTYLVAKGVAQQLIDAEHDFDRALQSVTKLAERIVAARLDANLSVNVNHEAIAKISAAIAALSNARTDLVHVHQALNIAKTRLGMREVSFGNIGGCPPMTAELSDNVVAIAS